MNESKRFFKCRMCGNDEYNKINMQVGQVVQTIGYQCSQCSTMFGDLEKFSVDSIDECKPLVVKPLEGCEGTIKI